MLKTIVGVVGLVAPPKQVAMPGGAILRRGSPSELAHYLGGDDGIQIPQVAYFEDVLVFVPASPEPAIAVLERLETVLQLSVNSAVGLYTSRDERGVLLGSSRGIQVGTYCTNRELPVAPDSVEVTRWLGLWNAIESTADTDTALRIRRGLRRYQRALEESDDEAIFHLVAASEAIVSPNNTDGGPRSRFMNRLSKVVAARPSQRKRIQEELGYFWSRRSGFAHGGGSLDCTSVDVLRAHVHRLLQAALIDPARFAANRVANLG